MVIWTLGPIDARLNVASSSSTSLSHFWNSLWREEEVVFLELLYSNINSKIVYWLYKIGYIGLIFDLMPFVIDYHEEEKI